MAGKPNPNPDNKQPNAADDGASKMTAAEAAKRVKRVSVVEDKGASRRVETPVAAKEVLAFKDYGSHVVVVTKDGQKFTDAPAETVEA